MEQRHQVIIVGGGPVGVALAVELGQRGISCALVERHLTPQQIPKGQNLTNRTLEHFYFWGCVDELRAARIMPPGYPIGGVTAYQSLMGEYWYTNVGQSGRGEGVRPFYFQANERLPQYLMESVLRRRLLDLPSVTTLFGWTATAFAHDDGGVRVTINGDAGSEQVLEAGYLVGCDGAHSAVRDHLGVDRAGRDFDHRMVLAVLRSRELHARLKRFPEATTYRVLRPELEGHWQFFGRIDVGEGFFFHAPVPNDATIESFDFTGLVHQAAGFPFACTLDHVGFWDQRIAVATKYQDGRVLIAGDACHSHPPYGGFGLNSGLEDVTNLGWKLAAVLDGWGGDRLLDSYTVERQSIFVQTGELIAAGIERDRAFLERFSPERDRTEFEDAWPRHGATAAPSQSYEPHYEGSTVVVGPRAAACGIQGGHSFLAQAGHHLTPQALSSGRNIFEELGPGFTLLAFGVEDGGVRAIEGAARSLLVPMKVIRESFEDGRHAYGSRLILVRPDQFVVWTANEPAPDAPGLLRRVVGIS